MVTRTKKIFVGGLSAPTTLEDVKSYFEQFGQVRDDFFYRFIGRNKIFQSTSKSQKCSQHSQNISKKPKAIPERKSMEIIFEQKR
jgi:RNA recognition motif-containing protein